MKFRLLLTIIELMTTGRYGCRCAGRTATIWESREAQIPHDFRPTIIAIDGPLLHEGTDEHVRRLCETVFIHAPLAQGSKGHAMYLPSELTGRRWFARFAACER
jgi:hypothetical protein